MQLLMPGIGIDTDDGHYMQWLYLNKISYKIIIRYHIPSKFPTSYYKSNPSQHKFKPRGWISRTPNPRSVPATRSIPTKSIPFDPLTNRENAGFH